MRRGHGRHWKAITSQLTEEFNPMACKSRCVPLAHSLGDDSIQATWTRSDKVLENLIARNVWISLTGDNSCVEKMQQLVGPWGKDVALIRPILLPKTV